MPNLKNQALMLIIACLFISFPVFSQGKVAKTVASAKTDSTSNQRTILDETEVIVVTGTKTSQSVSETVTPVQVITEKQIEASGAHNLDEVLNSIPGLSYLGRSAGSAEPLQMNGLTDEYVKILIDGVPITTGGSSDFISQTALDNVAQIEVINGSSSALYGSDAIGGVINIITKKNAATGLKFNVQQEGSSEKRATGNARIAYRGELFHAEVNAGYDYFAGEYEDSAYTYEETGNTYEYKNYLSPDGLKYNVRGIFGMNFGEGKSIGFNGTYSSSDTREMKGSSNKDGYYDREHSQLRGGLNYDWALTDKQNIEGYFSARKTTSGTKNENFDGTYDDETESIYGDIEGEVRYVNDLSNNHELLLGFNAIYSTYESNDKKTLESMFTSLFAQDLIKYNRLQLTPGVRINVSIPMDSPDSEMDDNEESHCNVSPQIGARYDLNNKVALRVTTGMGFKAPTFSQKYNTSYKGLGDPNLKSELSYTGTIGTEIKPIAPLKLTASGFVTYVEDKIDRVDQGNDANGDWIGRKYQNFAEVFSSGVNLQGNYHLNDWRATLSYNYLYMRSIENDEFVEMTGKIPHQVKADVVYTVPVTKTSIGLNGVWYAPKLSTLKDETNDETYSSDYLILNARADQSFLKNTLTVYCGVRNLLNNFSFKDATLGEDMEETYNTTAGATFYIGVKYKY